MFHDHDPCSSNEPPKRKRTKPKASDEATDPANRTNWSDLTDKPTEVTEVKPTDPPTPDGAEDEVMPDPDASSLEGPMGVDLPVEPALPLVNQDEDLDPDPDAINHDPQWHIDRYNEVRNDITRNLVRMAFRLQRAKRDLPHGHWMFYLKRIKMSYRVASRITGILKNKVLIDGTYRSQVPDSYHKLDKLKDLPEEQTRKAFEDGRIKPTMSMRDVEEVLHDYAEKEEEPQRTENQPPPAPEPATKPLTVLVWMQDSFVESEPEIFHNRDAYPSAVIVYIMPHGMFFTQSQTDTVIPLTLQTEPRWVNLSRFKGWFNTRPVYLIHRGTVPNSAADLITAFDCIDTLLDVVDMIFPQARKFAKGVEREGWEQAPE